MFGETGGGVWETEVGRRGGGGGGERDCRGRNRGEWKGDSGGWGVGVGGRLFCGPTREIAMGD